MTFITRLYLILTLVLSLSLALALAACSAEAPAPAGPVVLGPSSLQEALGDAADNWTAQGHARPVLSFAGSPTIARQIAGGAPADIVLLADEQWMDQLEGQDLLASGTRRALLGNRLVLIAPVGEARKAIAPNLNDLPTLLGTNRLAMADPDSVPAGRYGKMALQTLGLWDQLSNRIAPTENVRAALALVERGEAPLGIVYASDMAASDKVILAAEIPEDAQPAIRYPVAILASSTHADARGFLAYLASPEAEAIFARYRFFRLAEQ